MPSPPRSKPSVTIHLHRSQTDKPYWEIVTTDINAGRAADKELRELYLDEIVAPRVKATAVTGTTELTIHDPTLACAIELLIIDEASADRGKPRRYTSQQKLHQDMEDNLEQVIPAFTPWCERAVAAGYLERIRMDNGKGPRGYSYEMHATPKAIAEFNKEHGGTAQVKQEHRKSNTESAKPKPATTRKRRATKKEQLDG